MDQIGEILQPGRILYISVQLPLCEEKKQKRMILVGYDEDGDPLLLKVNSNQTFGNAHKIKKVQYTRGLAYDSVVNCGQVYVKAISTAELIETIKSDSNSHHECLSNDDVRQIWLRIWCCKTISAIHKDVIGRALGQL